MDLALPAFEMDCRHWVVSTPAAAGLPDELDDAPLLAVLSTVLLSDEAFREASGLLIMGLRDDELPIARAVAGGSVAGALGDVDEGTAPRQYALPAPDGQLALLAEFKLSDPHDEELVQRVEALMASFRWAS